MKGEARRVVSITNDKNGVDRDLLPGFPMNLGASVEASPKLADIVKAVNTIGVSPADLVAILEALKQAGAMKAELVVL